jgi:type IV pilus assembly protein PilE
MNLEMNKPVKKGYLDAFSLAEILIVLAVIGILIMLVVPNQTAVASRAKSIEAQSALNNVYTLQYSHFLQYSRYANDLNDIDYVPNKLVTEGGRANYRIEILEASTTGFRAKAEAVVDFNGDGKFNIWEVDETGTVKEVQKD